MPVINVKEYEHIDVSVRRFKRACEKDNILADIRKHEFYEKPKWRRRREKLAAIKRQLKKTFREGFDGRQRFAVKSDSRERN
jgi:small subunit ribosomal protein S21